MIKFWHENSENQEFWSENSILFKITFKIPEQKFQIHYKIRHSLVLNCNLVVNRLFFGEIKPKITISFAF